MTVMIRAAIVAFCLVGCGSDESDGNATGKSEAGTDSSSGGSGGGGPQPDGGGTSGGGAGGTDSGSDSGSSNGGVGPTITEFTESGPVEVLVLAYDRLTQLLSASEPTRESLHLAADLHEDENLARRGVKS